MRFNGSDYEPKLDDERLIDQHGRIKKLMRDGEWRTLNEIAKHTGDPEASISAQLRHLRKDRFGNYVIEKRRRGERKSGLFEYKLSPPGTVSEYAIIDRKNKLREALLAVWHHKDTTPAQRKTIRDVMRG